MDKILLGTLNKGKIVKYGDIFNSLGIKYVTPYDIDLNIEIEETGKTTRENSLIKAKAYHEATNMAVLCEDGGLRIKGLSDEEQPGVMVHRYGGRELDDKETIDIFSKLIEKLGGKAAGGFEYTLTFITKEGKQYFETFISPRPFVSIPSKKELPGFPLRSLMYYEDCGKYMSEMTVEEMGKAEGDSYNKQKEWIRDIVK